jgi:hypothetical protein
MQGNEYRRTPYKMPFENFCKVLKNEMFMYADFLACTNLPPKNTCPLPKVSFDSFFFMNLKNKTVLNDFRVPIPSQTI